MSKARRGAKSREPPTQRSCVTRSPGKQRNSLGLIVLEPRLLYDGAGAVSAAAAIKANAATAVVAAAHPAADGGKHEIVFIDSNVANWQTIANDSRSGVEVVLFNGNGDGLKEINGFLAQSGASNLDAIHIVSDGAQASLTVGTDVVTAATVSTYQADFSQLGATLKPGGDILLYGSSIGAGPDGQALIAEIATDTGANIEAATHATGNSASGGTWTLDATVGAPTTASLFTDTATADFTGTLSEAAAPPLIPSAAAPSDVVAANASLDNGKLEVVFVDTSVANYQALEASIRPGVEIVEIQPGASGLAQMAAWAGTHSDYDSIQILSHGGEGTIEIGADSLVDANLSSPTVRAELAAIGAALKPGGDILLFGCDVAAGADGQQFIADLSADTGAVVAASTDETGSADLGGNWTLEAATGVVTAQSAMLPSVSTSWEGLLSISTTGLVANLYAPGENTGGVTEAPNVYQQYTYTFTATTTSTQLSQRFSMRMSRVRCRFV